MNVPILMSFTGEGRQTLLKLPVRLVHIDPQGKVLRFRLSFVEVSGICGLSVQLSCFTFKRFISVLSAASVFSLLCPLCNVRKGRIDRKRKAVRKESSGVIFGKMGNGKFEIVPSLEIVLDSPGPFHKPALRHFPQNLFSPASETESRS